MLESIEKLLEIAGDMNETEINDHIKARPDGFVVSFRIDNEWLNGWNRAVLATIEKIEKEVSERFMELPKDADGEYIYIGDVMDGYGKTIEVVELRYGRSGWVLISRDGSGYADTFAFTHHHTPTVEDVLREFALAVCKDDALTIRKDVVDEYAAKLQLREDA